MISKEQAELIVEAHCIVEILEDGEEAQMLQEQNPELFDAYCALLCMAGIEIPDPSEVLDE